MTLAPAPTRLRKITSDEFGRLLETGVFAGERIELIDGRIVNRMPAQRNPHVYSLWAANRALDAAFPPARYWVRNQASLTVSALSTPDPDLAVLNYPPSSAGVFPDVADALLVIEVSFSTVARDRRRKMHLYAAGGLAEAVIVNVPRRRLEVHHDPVADPSARFGHRYATVTLLHPGDAFSPLAAPHARIAVADLF